MVVCLTDPSGGVSSYSYDGSTAVAGRRRAGVEGGGGGGGGTGAAVEEEKVSPNHGPVDVIVIGGEERAKAMLRQRLLEQLCGSAKTNVDVDNTATKSDGSAIDRGTEDQYADVLRRSIRATVDALAHLPNSSPTAGNRLSGSTRINRRTSTTDAKTTRDDNADDYEKVAGQIDLTIMTSRGGVQRLGKEQIMDLMRSVQRNKEAST